MIVKNRKTIIEDLLKFSLIGIFLMDHTIYSDYFPGISNIIQISFIIFLISTFFLTRKIEKNTSLWCKFLIFVFLIFIACLVNGVNRLFFVRIIYWASSFAILLLCKQLGIDYKDILFSIAKVFLIWSLISYLVIVLLRMQLPITLISNSTYYGTPVKLSAFILGPSFSKIYLGSFVFIRMAFPFAEPGIAQMYFNYALIYLLFEKDIKRGRVWIGLFSLGIILGFSLIGVLVSIVIWALYLAKRKNYIILIVIGGIGLFVLRMMVFEKSGTMSYAFRTTDYLDMINAIKKNFPFGIGFGNTSLIERTVVRGTTLESNGFYCGLLYPLMEFGIIGIAYYVLLFSFIRSETKRNFYSGIAVFSYLFLTLLTQPQADEAFIMLFLFYGLIRFNELKERIIEKTSKFT